MSGKWRFAALLAAACAWLALAGCRGTPSPWPPIHLNPNMDDQPRLDSQEASVFFYDGKGMREPVPGTVARGELRQDAAFFTGRDAAGEYLQESPVAASAEVLARGAERYTIYCTPCHDERGAGTGVLAQYASVPTASFHDEQRLGYTDGQIFEVITIGFGLMQGYAYPITPADRWAIVAHVRQLQQDRLARLAAGAGGAL
ncbi:MAG TPA: cytochrome c [Thermoanaerobaculia bacterium]|nr:cytochrome c [Thermoanaerobaculia bacterium]